MNVRITWIQEKWPAVLCVCVEAGLWISVSDHQRSHSARGRTGVCVQVSTFDKILQNYSTVLEKKNTQT